ncbi:TPA_exp: putative Cutinase [Trichophyton benhamiae CBS 112371]|uniref:cutinase n=1 Tax=Arthroderma benhamiae (strain ATCC MYA-4681 / CBS 112371) TaxID=663331 RepID=D4AVU9_ARTBC|nr:cutinase, putative [Trichophyton benhamiae CBS 112371]EFE32855.1 cutinase, putative [Trichophyton benhamiae CBS 112371]DAA75937.1 TPA_exp: putative Cutinase [Trichophyton benhamiae CBS 112371]
MKLESCFLLGLVACAIAAPLNPRDARIAASMSVLPGNKLPQWLEHGSGMTAEEASIPVFDGLNKLEEGLKSHGKTAPPSTPTDNDGLVENGILDHAPCQPLTMIFARGTNEDGNMGKGVGRPLAAALRAQTGNKIIIQGVNYDASIAGNLLLGLNGGPIMADLVKQSVAQCPDSKILLVGYSQGAMVTHAAKLLTHEEISAIAVFGDPGRLIPFANIPPEKTKEYCNEGDPVCLNGFSWAAHESYAVLADDAATFLIKASS